MAFLGKEYAFVKQENFETFLIHVGFPEDRAKAASAFAPAVKIEKNGDSYTLSYSDGPSGPTSTTFKSGVEFDDVLGKDQVPTKNTFVVDGNVVTQTIKTDKQTTYFKREYNGDDLVVTVTAAGWDGVAKRYYKA